MITTYILQRINYHSTKNSCANHQSCSDVEIRRKSGSKKGTNYALALFCVLCIFVSVSTPQRPANKSVPSEVAM